MEQEFLFKIIEAMSAAAKITEMRGALSVYSDSIIGAAGTPLRRRVILDAIRPHMDERKQRDVDIIIKLLAMKELADELRVLTDESRRPAEGGGGDV